MKQNQRKEQRKIKNKKWKIKRRSDKIKKDVNFQFQSKKKEEISFTFSIWKFSLNCYFKEINYELS